MSLMQACTSGLSDRIVTCLLVLRLAAEAPDSAGGDSGGASQSAICADSRSGGDFWSGHASIARTAVIKCITADPNLWNSKSIVDRSSSVAADDAPPSTDGIIVSSQVSLLSKKCLSAGASHETTSDQLTKLKTLVT